jgi:hypothetical protein
MEGILGNQQPRISSWPPCVSSTGDEAVELAAMAGLKLDPWQELVLRHSLGERENGDWAAFEVGLVVSRQNGKGSLLEARELAGLFLLNERFILHTSHLFDTSLEAFRRLLERVEGFPEFTKRIRRVSNSHGTEGIELKTGARIRFRTRTKGGGRGFTADLVVLDEAMQIAESTHAALLPTLSARKNPQVWYCGSAVDEEVDEDGVVFSRIRERGLSGDDPSLCYFEWSADLSLNRVATESQDVRYWAQANPALGIRISAEHIARERASMGSRKFGVERLGVGAWPRTDGNYGRPIDPQAWVDCRDVGAAVTKATSVAIDVPPDRSFATIAGAAMQADGTTLVWVHRRERGVAWVRDALRAMKPNQVILDGKSPAGALTAELENYLNIMPVSTGEYTTACALLVDAVEQRTLRHRGDVDLDNAVDGAAVRSVSDSWAWARRSSTVDISPLVAVTLALWGVDATPIPQVWDLNEIAERLMKEAHGREEEDRGESSARPQAPENQEGQALIHPNFVPL